jgi:hypothetical protein
MPSLSPDKQLEALAAHELTQVGCYPTEETIRKFYDLEKLNDRPYTKMLAMGISQLDFVGFDFAVLERYLNDPRFSLDFEDYAGHMSIRDEFYKSQDTSRDDVSIQTFGLGFDDKEHPVAIAFLRYLANLNSPHQLYWKSYEAPGTSRMCYQYYKASIVGDFYENASLVWALGHCFDALNLICEKIWGSKLFREGISERRPVELGIFVRPTEKNFQRFILAMDHLLSENLNEKFFPSSVPRTEEKIVRGQVTQQKIGSLRMFETWLFGIYKFHNAEAARANLVEPLKEVRKLRQRPAHATTKDQYDEQYYEQRRTILTKVLNALVGLVDILERHPKGVKSSLPDRVREGRLDPW